MSLFRSEPVLRWQLLLQTEAVYYCVAALGEIEAVQFLDANPELSAFQRKFVSEVKRCEDLERILRYIGSEARKENILSTEPGLYNIQGSSNHFNLKYAIFEFSYIITFYFFNFRRFIFLKLKPFLKYFL